MRRIENKLALMAVLLTGLVIGSNSLMGAGKAQQTLIDVQRVEQLDAAVRDLASLKPRVDELQQKVTRLEEASAALNKRLAALEKSRSQEIKK